jgi:hypothetical protein
VLFATVYDPGNRRGNVRLIIEGPFPDNATAVDVLSMLTKGGQFSVADTRVITTGSAQLFFDAVEEIRAMLKKKQ